MENPTSSVVTSSPSVAVVSTFPPTQCGLATFAASLVNGLQQCGVHDVGVVELNQGYENSRDHRVVSTILPNSDSSILRAVATLNSYDVALVQHEYGIFSGPDGESALTLIKQMSKPVVTTLHTVPLQPTKNQKLVLESVIANSSAAVTMTNIAKQRLLSIYSVDPKKVTTIPHGATIPKFASPTLNSPPLFLTWGLLGPGKGIESVIDAIAILRDQDIFVNYLVSGMTHPKVHAHSGETYRDQLITRVQDLGIDDRVLFENEYRSLASLHELLAKACCVILPYDGIDQITSGVLVDAIAAGKPVIATQFSHAVELLSEGAGLLVPPKHPTDLANAIRRVALDKALRDRMAEHASQLAVQHSWVNIAKSYIDLARRVSLRSSLEKY